MTTVALSRLPWCLAAALGLALLPLEGSAQAVQRCRQADGTAVFTDRGCQAAGAQAAPGGPAQSPSGIRPSTACAATMDELSYEIGAAVQAKDANRLASVYHWVGLTGREGYEIWSGLEAVVNRPLLNITPLLAQDLAGDIPPALSPESAPALPPPGAPAVFMADASTVRPLAGAPPVPTVPAVPRRQPVALRMDQSDPVTGEVTQTRFQLVRHLDCWWIRQ